MLKRRVTSCWSGQHRPAVMGIHGCAVGVCARRRLSLRAWVPGLVPSTAFSPTPPSPSCAVQLNGRLTCGVWFSRVERPVPTATRRRSHSLSASLAAGSWCIWGRSLDARVSWGSLLAFGAASGPLTNTSSCRSHRLDTSRRNSGHMLFNAHHRRTPAPSCLPTFSFCRFPALQICLFLIRRFADLPTC